MFTERKFIGSGIVRMRKYGTSDAIVDVGDVEEVKQTREIEIKTIPNLRGGGGNAAKLERLVAVNFAIKFRDLQAARLAQVLRGTSSDVAASSASSEAHTAKHGGYIPLDYIDPTSVVVKDVTDTTTYVLNTDYILGYNGIEILATGSIGDGDTVHISYSYSAQKVIEAFTSGAQQYEVWIDGINDADSVNKWDIVIWKWQMNYAEEINWLSQDYGELNSDGEALADSSQGAGESQYYRIRQTEA
jgi:hypothetical protein